jgi:hypothetical protein
MRNRFIALAALVGYAVAAPVMAQSSLYDDSQVLISKIQTDKRAIVLGGMGLTDAETTAFTPIYDEYQAERKKLADRTVDLLNKFVANNDSMTDAAAKGILKDWMNLKEERTDLLKKYIKRFGKVLPSPKVLRFVQIENKLDTAIEMQLVKAVPLVKP